MVWLTMQNASEQPSDSSVREEPVRLIVITGGPGAGKTAVLDIASRMLHHRIAVLPEAATLLFAGGFPRKESSAARKAAQRAIFHVQHELENLLIEESTVDCVICDRGTLDGLAYWPGPCSEFFAQLGTTREAELQRYATVIHLRTPIIGYNHQNPLRIETAEQARIIDERIAEAWVGHPQRVFIDNAPDFMAKAHAALAAIVSALPATCTRNLSIPSLP